MNNNFLVESTVVHTIA